MFPPYSNTKRVRGCEVGSVAYVSERYPRFGYHKIYHLLKAEHWGVNRETVRRMRKHEGLQVIKKERKRRPVGASTTTPTRATKLSHACQCPMVHKNLQQIDATNGKRENANGLCSCLRPPTPCILGLPLFRGPYWAIKPPSMTSSAPVTKEDSSEARYRAP